ncbi:Mediator of RNA polymerase II transcription subunit 14 [Pseudocercospora fuligena]|uniref:Mediator of RNA polymerase II transcription subunit 14 n=1 Tax=Pseudocercospora fuligena TaxID=685502 RepID=A0A8H6VRC7_9PEZI|nr:Mediator of RNA polymerase II transcription subunit 14 [Pseudocercospora fuligena]
MPGRLVMDQHGVTASQDLKKDRSQAQEGQLPQKRDFAQMQTSQANGSHAQNGTLPNGVPVQAPPATNGQISNADTTASLPTPPSLDGSWRDEPVNKSLGTLIERLAQQCFGDLNETLTKMAETSTSSGAQPNGILPHTTDTNEASLSKKRLLMDFASNQRDRFIKTLVLSDWARNAEDMARLIDIKLWAARQADAQRFAINFFYSTKQDMRFAKMPNPNIEGALELLSTGKTSNFPDLGYLPPKRLSAKQLLKTLKSMNVTLSERLNLHEDLPPHFNDFSVANGRATFRVSDEFEVDVSVADEDPSTPFYFIDIRFLFAPTPSLSDDGLRMHLEERANAALASSGLQGCYDFLHRYVLAHKVNALRAQASKLLRDKWFDCLQPEMHRQVFTLQYWKGQRAPKSWIELGISSGKQKGVNSRRPPTPRNSFRWFRQGHEVKDHNIYIDWQNLDLESILASVTAKHSQWLLRSIKERFDILAGPNSKVDVQLKTSDTDPDDCQLALSLAGLQKTVVTRFEPITGQISVSPPNKNAQQAEKFINGTANADAGRALAEVLARTVQDRLIAMADAAGWTSVDQTRIVVPPATKAMLGADAIRRSVYKCSQGWGDGWALYVHFGLEGEKWFVVRIQESIEQGRPVRFMSMARRLNLSSTLADLTQASLRHIQEVAEAEVSFAVLIQELDDSQLAYRIESASSLTKRGADAEPGLAIYFSMNTPTKQSGSKASLLPFKLASWIRLIPSTLIDVEDGLAEVRHEVRFTVDPSKYQQLSEHLTNSTRKSDIAMNDSGELGLKVSVPFGKPYFATIRQRLIRCDRLNYYLEILKRFGYRCTDVGLDILSFIYSDALDLAAQITFTKDAAQSAKLKLTPINNNPHQRIRVALEKSYNKAKNQGITQLTYDLRVTLPLLRLFDKLESAEPAGESVSVYTRDVHRYTLAYKAPLPACSFAISVQKGQSQISGQTVVSYRCKPEAAMSDDALSQALREFSKGSGSDWFGDNVGGFGAGAAGLDEAFTKLDQAIRKCDGAANVAVKKQDTPAESVKSKPTPASTQSQQPTMQRTQSQQRPPPQPRQHSRNSVKQEVIELD